MVGGTIGNLYESICACLQPLALPDKVCPEGVEKSLAKRRGIRPSCRNFMASRTIRACYITQDTSEKQRVMHVLLGDSSFS
jgi:hypothetical protein